MKMKGVAPGPSRNHPLKLVESACERSFPKPVEPGREERAARVETPETRSVNPNPRSPDTPTMTSTRPTRRCSQVGLKWSAKESEGSYSYAGVPCGVKNRAMTTSPPRTISTTVPEGCSHATYRGSSTSTRKGVPQARVPASS